MNGMTAEPTVKLTDTEMASLMEIPHPTKETTPLALRANVQFNHVLHEHVVIVSVQSENVPHIPIGQWFQPTAWRDSVTGMVDGFPVFWGVKRA